MVGAPLPLADHLRKKRIMGDQVMRWPSWSRTLLIVRAEVPQVDQCSRCKGRCAGVSLPVRLRVFGLFTDQSLRLQPDRVTRWLSYQLRIWKHVIKCEQVFSLGIYGRWWVWHRNMWCVAMEHNLRNLCGCTKHNFSLYERADLVHGMGIKRTI